MSKLALNELAHIHQTDKGTRQVRSGLVPKGYTIQYDYHFHKLRHVSFSLLEIGVNKGGSLRMWKEYFTQAQIYGIDIKECCKEHEEDRVKIFIGDQTDEEFLGRVVDQTGNLTIIVDDGGHKRHQQIASFNFLFPFLKPGGFYAIEDLTAGRSGSDRDALFEVISEKAARDMIAPLVKAVHYSSRLVIVQKGYDV